MPVYAFECYEEDGGCGIVFDISCKMTEIQSLKPKCPGCKKKKPVARNFNSDIGISVACTTVGAMADRNSERFSADYKNHLLTTQREKPPFSGKLPEGASLKPVDSKGKTLPSTKPGRNFGRLK